MSDFRNKDCQEYKAQETAKDVTDSQSEIPELVERAATGDFESFGELYSIYLERIYRYVFFQVKDKMTAEDITEEVFIKAWKAIGSCKGKGQTFSPWLYRIAHNHVIDTFRRTGKHLPLEIEAVDKVSNPGLKIERALEQQELLTMIAALPPNQRQVITLKFIDGLDNREIEQVMSKSQGAIRILQMRALAAIRQELNREQ